MPDVFYWCRGQDDNIGDVLLRRRLLRELRTLGRVHILIGKASAGFVESMRFEQHDVLYQSQLPWLIALYQAASRRGVVLAVNPGEVRVDAKSAAAYSALIPAQTISRLRGGTSLQAGIAVRGRHAVFSLPISLFGRNADLRTCRELSGNKSTDRVFPDWAFDELDHRGDEKATARHICAVTYRSDRDPLPAPAIEAIRKVCAERGMDIIVFSQVRRDNERSIELGAALGGEVILWDPAVSHLAQERKLREMMACSEVVISDRIHALIMGTSEGSTPLGLIPGPDGKVGPHFAAAGIADISTDVSQLDTDSVQAIFDAVLNRRTEIAAQVAAARTKVAELGVAVRSLGLRNNVSGWAR